MGSLAILPVLLSPQSSLLITDLFLPCEEIPEVLQLSRPDGNQPRSGCVSTEKALLKRRGARVADWARLEIVCAPNTGTEGSNPSLSASGDS